MAYIGIFSLIYFKSFKFGLPSGVIISFFINELVSDIPEGSLLEDEWEACTEVLTRLKGTELLEILSSVVRLILPSESSSAI